MSSKELTHTFAQPNVTRFQTSYHLPRRNSPASDVLRILLVEIGRKDIWRAAERSLRNFCFV